MSGGSAALAHAAAAMSASVTVRPGTPRTPKRPRSTTMSAGAASSSAAAMRLAFSSTFSMDAAMAGPPTDIERLPNVPTPAATIAVSLWRTEALVVDQRQHAVERGLVLPRVVDEARRRLVRELVGADQVAAAHVGGIQAALAGDLVHRPLADVRGLGPSGAPVRRRRHR